MADTKVKRIKANEAKAAKKSTVKSSKPKTQKTKSSKKQKKERNIPKWLMVLSTPFRAIGRYVVGAAEELKQTRWPNRKATWGLTVAVLIFTAFFATLILLVDYGFEQLLEMVLNIQGE